MIEFSPYVVVVVASLLTSQALKYLILLIKGRRIDRLRQLYASGSMPSTHSTSVVGLLTVIGLRDGTDSGLFGLALLLAVIVMYDTIILRRSVGDQGRAVQEIIKALKSTVLLPRAAKGHTPYELIAGAALGLTIGVVVFFATN